MAYTLSGMEAEVYARGFSYLSPAADPSNAGKARVDRWLNDARNNINAAADWPYLNTTVTGTAPLTITDLGRVESVTAVDLLQTLQPLDRRDLREWYADLTMTGTPWSWYLTGGNVVNVFPVSSSLTLTVDYWRFEPDMAAAGDVPLMPDRFRNIIVEYAVSMAHLDAENEASGQAVRQGADQQLAQMVSQLMDYQHQVPLMHVPAVGSDL